MGGELLPFVLLTQIFLLLAFLGLAWFEYQRLQRERASVVHLEKKIVGDLVSLQAALLKDLEKRFQKSFQEALRANETMVDKYLKLSLTEIGDEGKELRKKLSQLTIEMEKDFVSQMKTAWIEAQEEIVSWKEKQIDLLAAQSQKVLPQIVGKAVRTSLDPTDHHQLVLQILEQEWQRG